MKKFITLLPFLLPVACFAQVKEFGWLAGTWKIKNKETYEVWKIADDKKMLTGISFKVKGTDTLVTEKLKIREDKNSFYYIPDVPANQAEVYFKITAFNEKGFTAENPQHDFPKIIRYELQSATSLKAQIEGDGKVIPFYFDKVK